MDDLPFVELNDLALTAGTFGPSLITHVLRDPLPLARPTFGPWSQASTTQLLGLLADPSRLSSLKIVVLDIVMEPKRGTRIVEDTGGQPCSLTDDGVYGDWERAEWYPWLPREGAEQVVQAGRKAGVKVKGEVVKALQVEAEYEAEVEYARSLSG